MQNCDKATAVISHNKTFVKSCNNYITVTIIIQLYFKMKIKIDFYLFPESQVE